jgi:hypothetical protein
VGRDSRHRRLQWRLRAWRARRARAPKACAGCCDCREGAVSIHDLTSGDWQCWGGDAGNCVGQLYAPEIGVKRDFRWNVASSLR